MCFSNETGTYSSWQAFATTKSWPLSSGDGLKIVNVKFMDAAGNVSVPVSASITLDTTAPTGSILINGGATVTKVTNVTLALTANDTNPPITMCFSNDGTTYTATWESFTASRPYTLPSGDGTKTVYVKYKDVAGNISTYSAQIILDTTNIITASAGANGSISPSGEVIVNYGANQSFSITPNLHYHVADVLVDGVSVGAVTSYNFTNVTATHTIAASFAITTHIITASAGLGGTISLPGTNVVSDGSSPSFTITPAQNYNIKYVLVDGVSVGPVSSYTFPPVTADHTISAYFMAKSIQIVPAPQTLNIPYLKTATFQVKLSDNPYGSVAVSVAWLKGNSNIQVQSGASLTFTQDNWNTPQTVTLVSNVETGTTITTYATFQLTGNDVTQSQVTALWVERLPNVAPIMELLLND